MVCVSGLVWFWYGNVVLLRNCRRFEAERKEAAAAGGRGGGGGGGGQAGNQNKPREHQQCALPPQRDAVSPAERGDFTLSGQWEKPCTPNLHLPPRSEAPAEAQRGWKRTSMLHC